MAQQKQHSMAAQYAALVQSVIVDAVDGRLSRADQLFTDTPGHTARDRVAEADPGAAFAANLREQICRRAYEIAEQRGFASGDPVGDWLQAEREVLVPPDVQAMQAQPAD